MAVSSNNHSPATRDLTSWLIEDLASSAPRNLIGVTDISPNLIRGAAHSDLRARFGGQIDFAFPAIDEHIADMAEWPMSY